MNIQGPHFHSRKSPLPSVSISISLSLLWVSRPTVTPTLRHLSTNRKAFGWASVPNNQNHLGVSCFSPFPGSSSSPRFLAPKLELYCQRCPRPQSQDRMHCLILQLLAYPEQLLIFQLPLHLGAAPLPGITFPLDPVQTAPP